MSARRNRDNRPKRLSRKDVQTNIKPFLILVDAENVPDLKKVFYADQDGTFRFVAPVLPQFVSAPNLSLDPTLESLRSYSMINPEDSDIFILAYAHERSAQSSFANRVTTSFRKDAADGETFSFSLPLIAIV